MRTALLIAVALLAGCAQQNAFVDRGSLCRSWRHQTVSKHDRLTEVTAAGILGNNGARVAWGCQTGANRAK